MARRKKEKKADNSGGGGWITTFADLMSLLLTFFILLFSMSSVSDEKFNAASASLEGAFIGEISGGSILDRGGIGVDETGVGEDGLSDSDSTEAVNQNSIPAQVTEMYDEALKIIEAEGIGDQVSVSSDQDGVYLDIQESILFGSGRATISELGKDTLDSLVSLLTVTDNDIIVEGFTDNMPIRTAQYSSNWELSAARAMGVVRYLAENKSIDASRLSGRGYGEFNPVEANDTDENRAKNRRVNIVIVYKPEAEE